MKISKKSLAQQIGVTVDKIVKYEKCEIKLTENKLRAILKILRMESALIESDIALASKPSAQPEARGAIDFATKDAILNALSGDFYSTMRRLLIVTRLSKSAVSRNIQDLLDDGAIETEYFKNDTGRGRANAAYRKAST